MQITNLINSRGNAVKNQFIIREDKKISFQSYASDIAAYDEENKTLLLFNETWDYSNTTRNYFKTFINNFTRFKYEDRQQWLKEIEANKDITIK